MWATLATAATTLLTGQSAAFTPPDCMRPVPHGVRNGDIVVGTKKPGLWLASANGAIKRQLTGTKGDREATFSPDGRKIVFQRFKPKAGHAAIFTLDLRNGRTRQIFVTKHREETAEAPVWSPDGRWIAFVRETDKGDDYRSTSRWSAPTARGFTTCTR